MSEDSQPIDECDVLKILLATDIHLGYNEKDSVRGNDSFIAFEEILLHAVQNNVDFILLGGDLFHDANPSQNSLQKCLKLLRRYTLGDRAIAIEFLSDQSFNFHDALNGTVNYEDPNVNIAYPVFSIHGNHDDPSGFGGVSSLDLLSTSGMVNYFGKCLDLTEIYIRPILLRKGKSQLALYGLSYIHDNRLARLFHESKVIMEQPDKEQTGKWFNMLVLHQNRADRGLKNYLPESILPEFLDLVMWGHEHDCRIEPEENPTKNFFVTQPGSSVATSLAEGEAIDKHVGLLEIYEGQFKLTPIKLQTVRPFIFESVNLIDMVDELGLDEHDAGVKVQEYAKQKVEEMMEAAKEKLTGHPEQPIQPLIRLRLIFDEERLMFNTIRFGQQYNTRIANPLDIVHFKRNVRRTKTEKKPFDPNAMSSAFDNQMDMEDVKVEDIVERYFNDVDDDKKLEVLITKNMSELLRRLVQYDDDDAADQIISFTKAEAIKFMKTKMPDEENVGEELLSFVETSEQLHNDTLKMLDSRGAAGLSSAKRSPSRKDNAESDAESDDKENYEKTTARKTTKKANTTVNARGSSTRARGKGSRGGRVATSVKKELNLSTSKAQPTIQQSMSQSSRPTRKETTKRTVVYDISDDSD